MQVDPLDPLDPLDLSGMRAADPLGPRRKEGGEGGLHGGRTVLTAGLHPVYASDAAPPWHFSAVAPSARHPPARTAARPGAPLLSVLTQHHACMA